jgi:hypothetical protein
MAPTVGFQAATPAAEDAGLGGGWGLGYAWPVAQHVWASAP